jgi:hypothetical protein
MASCVKKAECSLKEPRRIMPHAIPCTLPRRSGWRDYFNGLLCPHGGVPTRLPGHACVCQGDLGFSCQSNVRQKRAHLWVTVRA